MEHSKHPLPQWDTTQHMPDDVRPAATEAEIPIVDFLETAAAFVVEAPTAMLSDDDEGGESNNTINARDRDGAAPATAARENGSAPQQQEQQQLPSSPLPQEAIHSPPSTSLPTSPSARTTAATAASAGKKRSKRKKAQQTKQQQQGTSEGKATFSRRTHWDAIRDLHYETIKNFQLDLLQRVCIILFALLICVLGLPNNPTHLCAAYAPRWVSVGPFCSFYPGAILIDQIYIRPSWMFLVGILFLEQQIGVLIALAFSTSLPSSGIEYIFVDSGGDPAHILHWMYTLHPKTLPPGFYRLSKIIQTSVYVLAAACGAQGGWLSLISTASVLYQTSFLSISDSASHRSVFYSGVFLAARFILYLFGFPSPTYNADEDWVWRYFEVPFRQYSIQAAVVALLISIVLVYLHIAIKLILHRYQKEEQHDISTPSHLISVILNVFTAISWIPIFRWATNGNLYLYCAVCIAAILIAGASSFSGAAWYLSPLPIFDDGVLDGTTFTSLAIPYLMLDAFYRPALVVGAYLLVSTTLKNVIWAPHVLLSSALSALCLFPVSFTEKVRIFQDIHSHTRVVRVLPLTIWALGGRWRGSAALFLVVFSPIFVQFLKFLGPESMARRALWLHPRSRAWMSTGLLVLSCAVKMEIFTPSSFASSTWVWLLCWGALLGALDIQFCFLQASVNWIFSVAEPFSVLRRKSLRNRQSGSSAHVIVSWMKWLIIRWVLRRKGDDTTTSNDNDSSKQESMTIPALMEPLPVPSGASPTFISILRATNYYAVLGKEETATFEELRKAKRTLSLAVHPDKAGNAAGAADACQRVLEAAEVLLDPVSREKYDQEIAEARYYSNGTAAGISAEQADIIFASTGIDVTVEDYHVIPCGGKCTFGAHQAVVVPNRTADSARWCSDCRRYHAVKEGEIWMEGSTSWNGFIPGKMVKMLICVDGKVYDASDLGQCLNYLQVFAHAGLTANAHENFLGKVLDKKAAESAGAGGGGGGGSRSEGGKKQGKKARRKKH